MAHGSLQWSAQLSQNSQGRSGQADLDAVASEFGALSFLINQTMNGRNFVQLVKIIKVVNAGELTATGFVDVMPLVNQLDGQDNAVPHGVIYNLPYFRVQGGANAVIIDPQVSDIGLAVFADRDISAVKASKAQANPGSMRRGSYADGLYLGGFLNGAPSQVVRFASDGIHVTSPTAVHIVAPAITSAGDWQHDGDITATGDVTADGVSLKTHTHGGVTAGADDSGGPN